MAIGGSNGSDLGAQVAMQARLLELLEANSAINARIAEILASQVATTLGMQQALNSQTTSLEESTSAAQQLSDSLSNVEQTADDGANALLKQKNAAEAAAAAALRQKKTTVMLRTAWDGLGSSISAGFSIISGAFGIISSFVRKIGEAAIEVLALSRQIAEAWEAVREQLGDLTAGSGRVARESFSLMSKSATEAGINIGRRFGFGADAVVSMIKAVEEAVSSLGDLGTVMMSQMPGVAFMMDTLAKGAGITADGFQNLANRALYAGGSLKQVMEETSNAVAALATVTGQTTKVAGKVFNAIASTAEISTSMTIKQMGKLSAVLLKTGISISTVTKVVEKFDNFETAADSVARLTQAFGMNLSAIDLLNASDEQRLQMLKSSFTATGKSLENLTRQEKKYLAEAAGVTLEDLPRLFGEQAGAIDETATAAERAQKAQIDSAKSLQMIDRSIRTIFGPLAKMAGLFETFFDGLDTGFKNSKSPLQVFGALLQDIMEMGLNTGRELARLFSTNSDLMDGIKIITGEIRKFFALFSDVIVAAVDPKKSVDGPLTSLINHLASMLERGLNMIAPALANAFITITENEEIKNAVRIVGDGLFKLLGIMVSNPSSWMLFFAAAAPAIVIGLASALTSVISNVFSVAVLAKIFSKGEVGLFAAASGLFTKVFSKLGAGGSLIAKFAMTIPNLFMGAIKFAFSGATGTKIITWIAANITGPIAKGIAKVTGSLLSGGVLAIIMGGMSAARVDDVVGKQLDKQYDRVATKAAAKSVTAILDFLTLGLMSDSMLSGIATFFASVSNAIFSFLDFGLGGFSKTLDMIFGGFFESFAGLGDFINEIFFGEGVDVKKILDASTRFFTGIFDMLIGGLLALPALFIDILSSTLRNLPALLGRVLVGLGSIVIGFFFGLGVSIAKAFENFIAAPFRWLTGDDQQAPEAAAAAAYDGSSIAREAAASAGEQAGAITEVTAQTVETQRALARQTRDLGEEGVTAQVVVDDYSRGVARGKNKIKVDRDKIEMHVKVDVILDAETLSRALINPLVVGHENALAKARA